jgi:hypothetical protein
MTIIETRARSMETLVGDRVYFLAFSLSGPDATPYREIDQPCSRINISTLGGTRTRSLRVEGPASSPLRPRGRARLRRQGSNLRSRG